MARLLSRQRYGTHWATICGNDFQVNLGSERTPAAAAASDCSLNHKKLMLWCSDLSGCRTRGRCEWCQRPGPGSAASVPPARRQRRCRSSRRRNRPDAPSYGPGFLLATRPRTSGRPETSAPGSSRWPANTPRDQSAGIHWLEKHCFRIGFEITYISQNIIKKLRITHRIKHY